MEPLWIAIIGLLGALVGGGVWVRLLFRRQEERQSQAAAALAAADAIVKLAKATASTAESALSQVERYSSATDRSMQRVEELFGELLKAKSAIRGLTQKLQEAIARLVTTEAALADARLDLAAARTDIAELRTRLAEFKRPRRRPQPPPVDG